MKPTLTMVLALPVAPCRTECCSAHLHSLSAAQCLPILCSLQWSQLLAAVLRGRDQWMWRKKGKKVDHGIHSAITLLHCQHVERNQRMLVTTWHTFFPSFLQIHWSRATEQCCQKLAPLKAARNALHSRQGTHVRTAALRAAGGHGQGQNHCQCCFHCVSHHHGSQGHPRGPQRFTVSRLLCVAVASELPR